MKHLQNKLEQFRDDRNWQDYHAPRNLVLALCGEVGELAEVFQWADDGRHFIDPETREKAAEEIADIMIYALNLCNALDLDAESIIRAKMQINAEKYPIER